MEDWPEPPNNPDDEIISPYSDSYYGSNDGLPEALPLDLTFNGTYVIRKGRKKERCSLSKNLPSESRQTPPPPPVLPPVKYERQSSLEGRNAMKGNFDLKRASSTFDNIKSLLKEGLIEGLNDPPPDFSPPNPPKLVRVVSLPTLSVDKSEVSDHVENHHRNSKCERFCKMNELAVTLEEAEDELNSLDNPSLNDPPDSLANDEEKENVFNGNVEKIHSKREYCQRATTKKCNEVETQTDLSDTEAQNELDLAGKQFSEMSKTKSELEEVEKKIQEIVKIKTVIENQAREEEFSDPWVKAEDKPPDEFPVNVEVLQHDFGPLPPSPVEEDDDEDDDDEEEEEDGGDKYSNVFRSTSAQSSGKVKEDGFYRCEELPNSDPSGKYLNRPPEPLPHRASDPIPIGLICRSSDAGFNRGPRLYSNESRNEVRIFKKE